MKTAGDTLDMVRSEGGPKYTSGFFSPNFLQYPLDTEREDLQL